MWVSLSAVLTHFSRPARFLKRRGFVFGRIRRQRPVFYWKDSVDHCDMPPQTAADAYFVDDLRDKQHKKLATSSDKKSPDAILFTSGLFADKRRIRPQMV